MVELSRQHGALGEAWTVCHWHEGPHAALALPFNDAASAANWLRGLQPGELRRLASTVLDTGLLHRQTEAALADRLGAMVFSGELRVFPGRPQAQRHPGAGDQPTAEQRLLRRLPTTSRNFHFEGERWRIVDALHWASLRGSEDERFDVVPRAQAQAVLGRLMHTANLPLDEAQALGEALPLLPEAWRPSQPGAGLLLIRIAERAWNIESAGGAEAVTPSQMGGKAKEVPQHWIQIALVDTDNQPVPGAAYKVALPDGDIREGRLDAQGQAYIGGMATGGQCKVCFPQIDSQEWRAL
ncbi:MAG: hypothetical protein HY855_16235 [Burkholderiales bacterium]|nr:hypothetical protein [Burkholderiales bacterium]